MSTDSESPFSDDLIQPQYLGRELSLYFHHLGILDLKVGDGIDSDQESDDSSAQVLDEDPFDSDSVPRKMTTFTIPNWDDEFDAAVPEDQISAWSYLVRLKASQDSPVVVVPAYLHRSEKPSRKYPTLDEYMNSREFRSSRSSRISSDSSSDSDTLYPPSTSSSPSKSSPCGVSRSRYAPYPSCSPRSTPTSSPTKRVRFVDDTSLSPDKPSNKRIYRGGLKKNAVRPGVVLPVRKVSVKERRVKRSLPTTAVDSEDQDVPVAAEDKWFYCPYYGCPHKSRAQGDMQRHLQCSKHQIPSVDCPRGCGRVFTRVDAAKRHSKSKRCQAGKEIE